MVELGKVVIFYDGSLIADWSIMKFRESFEKRGYNVELQDINSLVCGEVSPNHPEQLDFSGVENLTKQGFGIWLNRIYPSKSEKGTTLKAIALTGWLTGKGLVVLNPTAGCVADYDKFFAYSLMKEMGVPTPKTVRITPESSIEDLVNEVSLPCIVKSVKGGRGIGMVKINTIEKLRELMQNEAFWSGDFIIQQFLHPVREHDLRVGVIFGKPLISYGRTLVKGEDAELWMGSCYHGSRIINYDATEEERAVAVAASAAIGALINEVDIQITTDGPMVIENNPTPGYDPGEEKWIELIVDAVTENISGVVKNVHSN